MLSQKTKDTLLGPLNVNNPVVVQVLGIKALLFPGNLLRERMLQSPHLISYH